MQCTAQAGMGNAAAALLTLFVYIADVSCYMPANGETTTIFTNPSIPVDISLGLLKRETAIGNAFSARDSSFHALPLHCSVFV